MHLKKILFYTFFIITSSSLSTVATTDSMQNTLTQETSNKIDSFYKYDVVDYLCTYKLTSTTMTVIYYCFILPRTINLSLNLTKSNNFITYHLFPYILFSTLFYLFIVILWATLFRDGLNSFKKRFLF